MKTDRWYARVCVAGVLVVVGGCGGKTGRGNAAVSGGGAGATSHAATASGAGGANSEERTRTGVSQPAVDSGGSTGSRSPYDKVDVLFTIDNSLAMLDKQRILANGLPRMLRRLTNPDCVDPARVRASLPSPDPEAACPDGLVREFAPLRDLHVGVITSSLGDFGGDICPEGEPGTVNEAHNDHAWLLGALPRNSSTLEEEFLSWTGADSKSAYSDQIALKGNVFSNYVMAAGELGCGFEMVLESWYRFLIDPEPPVDVYMRNKTTNERGPVDSTILELRKRFLRPDSLLVVFMLSDENDCSMKDQGTDVYSWVAMTNAGGLRMWRGSSVCEENPNDPCCFSCMLGTVSSECQAKDPECKFDGQGVQLSLTQDPLNMRCRQTKSRFGYDFLFPPNRYVNALTKPILCPRQTYGDLDCDCAEAKAKGLACEPFDARPNPLYTKLDPSYVSTGPDRTGPDSVLLAGVVGVPWQDLAKSDSIDGALEYKRSSELQWDLFAPPADEDYTVTQPLDPFMIESTSPRAGTHPVNGQVIAPPESPPSGNVINGHEWYTSQQDVQYACVFSLEAQLRDGEPDATRLCDRIAACGKEDSTDSYAICARHQDWCPCTLTDPASGTKGPLDPTISLSPLCQNHSDGEYGNRQYSAGAYPGLRELQVLRGFHETTATDNAVVGSICPKDLRFERRNETGYGYNPALDAAVEWLGERLGKAAP